MSKSFEDFKKLPPARQAGLSAVIAVALALIFVAQRDIQRRPSSEVRGNKLIWRVLCLNAVGAIGYLVWGRRDPS
jgi:hypothetical protein